MLVLGATVIGASDAVRAARFWGEALGLTAQPPKADDGFINLFDGRGRLQLSIQRSDEPAPNTPRLHLDLYAPDTAGQKREVTRLLSLGATTVEWRYPDGADFVVLADTEGNRFCVIDNARAPEGFRLDFDRISGRS
ncbi:VOC family protein [Rhodococcus fascians]|nr:VOC family protein [Rhodococcus fascians]MBY4236891.1 VOC family protein [Rhodococcus fascians]MBY4252863.1 VOC family protein [Rhodococcus fascians]MBY4268207.1 VOC family protein [Rhodococcus fascians]